MKATHTIRSSRITRGGFDHRGEYNVDLPQPKFEVELSVAGGADGYPVRVGVGQLPAGQMGRKQHGGPMVPGPWAFAYNLPTVLSAEPMKGDPIIAAEVGDIVALDGEEYVIQWDTSYGHREGKYVKLEPVR